MKRIRPTKKVLIKRIRPKLDEYDYIFVEGDKVDHLIEAREKNLEMGTVFERAGIFARLEYKVKHIKKSKLFNQVLLLIIGGIISLIIQYIFENWVK